MCKHAQAIPVELLGGPFDGHETDVPMNDPEHDVYVFEADGAAHAYAWRGTSNADGKRWLLGYLQKVGRRGGV
jgi:hypothetical protein